MILLEARPEVVRFMAQPFMLRYLDPFGKNRTYVPDIGAEYYDGSTEIIEVKPRRWLMQEGVSERLQHVGALIEQCAYRFSIWNEDKIWSYPRLQNSKFLMGFRGYFPAAKTRYRIFEALESGPCPIRRLFDSLTGSSTPEADVYSLVLRGDLAMDLDQPIGQHSYICIPEDFRK